MEAKATAIIYAGLIKVEPRWSPDGKHLIFCGNRDGTPQVYTLDVPESFLPQR